MKNLLLYLCLLGWTLEGIAQSDSLSQPVFISGENGYVSFRIPALVRTPEGSLLAFAEGRRHSANDTGDIDLVLRRSADGGRTWSPLERVWDDGAHVCGNPAPVVDPATGRVLLLACWNDGHDTESRINTRTSRHGRRIFLLASGDDGRSWSAPREITSQVKDSSWTWYATGPCHAIVLTHTPFRGRIVVPCDHGVFELGQTHYSSHVIFSDDGGITWRMGGKVRGGNESTVAELSDGRVMLNMRWQGRLDAPREQRPVRRVAISEDGGATFGAPKADSALVEPVCNGSLLGLHGRGRATSRLVFSNPANASRRTDLTVRASRDDGRTWSSGVCLARGAAAYSDLVQTPRGVGVLYEARTPEGRPAILFRVIPFAALFQE